MRTIKDRFLLGCICGLAADLVKSSLCTAINRRGVSCPERAAAFFVPSKRVNEPAGKALGSVADAVMASLLGVAQVYMLSATGKDHAVVKGAALGAASWYGVWGGLTSIGVTSKTRKVSPYNALAVLATNTAFGATASLLATKLGDPGLFNGEIPWFPSREQDTSTQFRAETDDNYEQGTEQRMYESVDWS